MILGLSLLLNAQLKLLAWVLAKVWCVSWVDTLWRHKKGANVFYSRQNNLHLIRYTIEGISKSGKGGALVHLY